jgi:hypothetical protein
MVNVSNTNNKINDFICSPKNLSKFIGPYGYIQCTYERFPKITHINTQMIEYLGRAEKDDDLEEFLKENIFFSIIPFEDRDVFKKCLKDAIKSDVPVSVEHRIRCGDGVLKNFVGWCSVTQNENGEKEFVFIYMLKEDEKQTVQENPYYAAFKNTYDIIFEINYVEKTVECIYGKNTSNIGALYDVVMTLDSAQEFWINNYVYADDKEMMRKYLAHICTPGTDWGGLNSIQSKFRLTFNEGKVDDYIGNAIKFNSSTVLFAVRKTGNQRFFTSQEKEMHTLHEINDWLNIYVKDTKNALAMMLFEWNGETYNLLYASENICKHIKIGEEKYLRYITHELPMEECLEEFDFSKEYFEKLINEQELKHSYVDENGDNREVILTCSPIIHENETIYEILITDESANTVGDVPASGIYVRTFGHFDVFVDGMPITFTSEKEKELMALLIDRNGGTLTSSEAITYLWEDEEINERTSTRYRKLAMGLKNTLAKHHIEHILINNHGVRNIDVSAIVCDYYELLAGNKHYQKMFHNMYMTNYSWAEDTLATLWDYS